MSGVCVCVCVCCWLVLCACRCVAGGALGCVASLSASRLPSCALSAPCLIGALGEAHLSPAAACCWVSGNPELGSLLFRVPLPPCNSQSPFFFFLSNGSYRASTPRGGGQSQRQQGRHQGSQRQATRGRPPKHQASTRTGQGPGQGREARRKQGQEGSGPLGSAEV